MGSLIEIGMTLNNKSDVRHTHTLDIALGLTWCLVMREARAVKMKASSCISIRTIEVNHHGKTRL